MSQNNMNEHEFNLLMHYLTQYFSLDEIETLLENHPLTGFGDNGQISIRRMLSELSVEYCAKAYIADQFQQEFGDYAKEILSTLKSGIESNTQENIAVVAPRSHGKSSISSLILPVYAAIHNKKSFVLFISANSETAENFLNKVKRVLESPEIIEDFGVMKDRKLPWNNNAIETTNGVEIACTGWESGLRGMNKSSRPDLIILDDLESKKTMESESLQIKLDNAFREEIGRLGNYKTDFFYIGTLLSQDSLLARVINEPSWKTLFYKRVISFPINESLWEEWKAIYRDMDNPNRLDDAYQFFLDNQEMMSEGVKVLWEDKVPLSESKYKDPTGYYHVMLDREKWGESSFWKEDQNSPRSSQEFIFQTLNHWETLPSFDDMKVVLGVDPSMGKKNSDYQALVVMGKHNQTGRKYIIDSLLLKIKPTELLTTILDLCEKYPITQVGVESTAFQEYLADDLKQRLKENEMYHVVLTKKKPRQNKHSRIENLEPFISTSEILFNKDASAFNNQVKEYSKRAKNDDAIDCVQLTFELIEGGRRRKPYVVSKPSFL